MKIMILVLYLAAGGSFPHPETLLEGDCRVWAHTINTAIANGAHVVDDHDAKIVRAECRSASEISA